MDGTVVQRTKRRFLRKCTRRKRFVCLVYLLTLVWLLLALVQWAAISITERKGLIEVSSGLSNVLFGSSMFFFIMFIFMEEMRFTEGLDWTIAVMTVEFVIVGLFTLVVEADWKDMTFCFGVCLLMLLLFLYIGAALPLDLTQYVVEVFMVAFIFMFIGIFCVQMHVVLGDEDSFFAFQFFLTVVILLFIMHHAQIINGHRFVEIRLMDYLLASKIIFFDFILIFLPTFYMQKEHKILSSYFENSTETNTTKMDDEIRHMLKATGKVSEIALDASRMQS